jgi:hypothetical protein
MTKQPTNFSEQDVDLSDARTRMQAIPVHSKVLQLIESNQLQEAQTDLCLYALTEMKIVWDVNYHYKGALEEDLKPLLLDAYPPVRRVVDATVFARWPKSAFLEMSNFMAEADAFVRAEHKTNEMGSSTN